MVAGWTSYCNSQKWDSRSTPQYESKYWDWICATFPGRFKSFREYSAATSFMTTMKKCGLWEDYRDYCWNNVVFSTPDLDSSAIFHVNARIVKALLKHGSGSGYVESWKRPTLEILKLAVPTADGVPWIIKNTKTADGRLPMVLVPMKASKAFTASKAPEGSVNQPRPKGKAKAKGKAKTKSKQAARLASSLDEEKMDAEVTEETGTRDTLWIDDVVNAVEYTVQEAARRNESAISTAYLLSLQFVIE
eukprot:6303388-Pyramimonas_sp.AAC.1